MPTETVLIAGPSAFGDCQHWHEALRKRALTVGALSSVKTRSNDLSNLISNE